VCLPPKHVVFPHLAGEILGFGGQKARFEQYQEHGIALNGQIWDFNIFGIVKFFHLAMENSPNILDALFTPRRCVLSSTAVGEMIRERRQVFLHRGAWHKFKGYAYSQLNKVKSKKPDPDSKRAALVEAHGYDTKYAYHIVRLLLEVEMLLAEHDMDLERHREQMKSVRRGEWSLERLTEWATTKEKDLESLYASSTLPYKPDEQKVKALLLECLEHHYGDLSAAVHVERDADRILTQIAKLAGDWR
jgi:predicted nucleotidyltransferase